MAGEPALDKVLTALKAALSVGLDGVTVDVDRAEDDAYGNAELGGGAVNIIHQATDFSPHDHGTTEHRASIDLSMVVERKAATTNAAQLREMEADLVAALWANRTLGGLVQDITWTGADGADDVRENVAARVLSIEILFLTPLGDHRTVIGASGLIP